MFFGTYSHRLNSKNQVTVPSRIRDAVDEAKEGSGFRLLVADKNCLYLYTPRGIEEIVETMRAKGGLDNQQDFLRMFYANVVAVECDKQGRIVLPAAMKEAVGIEQDLVFVGTHRRVEIWNPERWEEYCRLHGEEYGLKLGKVAGEVFGL